MEFTDTEVEGVEMKEEVEMVVDSSMHGKVISVAPRVCSGCASDVHVNARRYMKRVSK